jgi:REP element-mobilizing transposase RayT
MAELKAISNYDLMAWIIIPDHFHMIIDPKENNISDLMKKLKLKFAYQYRNAQKSHRATIWQSRF